MQFDRKKISQENKTMKIAYSIKMRFTACYNKVAISKKLGTAQELSKMEKQVPRWYLSQMSRYLSNVDGSRMARVYYGPILLLLHALKYSVSTYMYIIAKGEAILFIR